MAVNRFDSPAQDKYFNTNVPFAYEQVMGTVVARQAQLQREQDMLNKTYEDTQNLKYIPGTKDEAYIRDYLGKTTDMVSRYYGADLSDPIVKQKMRSEFNNMTNRQNIQNIQTSWQGWAANAKQKSSLREQGQYNSMLDEDPANANWDTIGGGKTYDYSTPAFKPHRPVAEQFFNNLDNSVFRDSKGDVAYTKDGYILAGVNKGQTDRVINTKWTDFDNTYEGKQAVTIALKERGLNPNDPKNRETVAKQLLQEVAPEYWRETIAGSRAPQGRSGSGSDNDSRKTLTMQDQPIIPKYNDPLDVGEVTFGDKGIITNKSPESILVEKERANQLVPYPATDIITKSDEATRADKHNRLAKVREAFPTLKDLSDKDTYEAYKGITNDARAMSQLPLVDISQRAKQGMADYIGSTLTNKDIYIEDSFGSTDITNANDKTDNSALKEIGWTPAILSTELQNYASGKPSSIKVAGLAPGARKSGMIQLEVLDNSRQNKGQFRKLYMDTNRDFAQITAPANSVAKLIENMQPGKVLIGVDANRNPVYAKVSNNVLKDPSNKKWTYSPIIEKEYTDVDGSIKHSRITIDDIINQQLNELSDPKYNLLNSQVDETAPTNSFQ